MKILQNGYQKSGNYWLYKILTMVLDVANVKNSSYIQSSPIYSVAKTWNLSYPEQAGLDVLDIQRGINYCRISSRYKEPIIDIQAYVDSNRLVWSHSRYIPDSGKVYDLFDKVIYIIRDPRDAAISMSHFAFSEYRTTQFFNPFSSPEEYLNANLGKHLTGWCQHVGSHVLAPKRENIYVLFYENLKNDFEGQFNKVIDFLELSVDDEDRQIISDAVTVHKMQKQSPGHVRKGSSGGWKTVLSPSQIRYANWLLGPLLKELGYSRSLDVDSLPSLPDNINVGRVRSSMRRSMILRGMNIIGGNSGHLVKPDAAQIASNN